MRMPLPRSLDFQKNPQPNFGEPGMQTGCYIPIYGLNQRHLMAIHAFWVRWLIRTTTYIHFCITCFCPLTMWLEFRYFYFLYQLYGLTWCGFIISQLVKYSSHEIRLDLTHLHTAHPAGQHTSPIKQNLWCKLHCFWGTIFKGAMSQYFFKM